MTESGQRLNGDRESDDEIGGMQKQPLKGLSRLLLWQKTWLNSKWRRRWRKKWGKNRWKPELREKWVLNRQWRRKWMKKLRKNWWNVRWRRLWQKCWLSRTWWTKVEKERKRRKRFWMKKWRKSGCKTMGLTFHQFLLTQRRLKSLKNVRPGVVQRKRQEKRMRWEMLMFKKQMTREMYNEERRKHKFFLRRWFHWVFEAEHFGPETFGLRPAVIQFKLYLLNALQGFASFVAALWLTIGYSSDIPPAAVILGPFFIVYSATAMDFFGSIFGMLTSYHLESYYGQKPFVDYDFGDEDCLNCFRMARKNPMEQTSPSVMTESKTLDRMSTMAGMRPKGIASSNVNLKKWKDFIKRGKKFRNARAVQSITGDEFSLKSDAASTLFSVLDSKSITGRHLYESTTEFPESRKDSVRVKKGKTKLRKEKPFSSKQTVQKRCKCKGLKFLYCSFLRKCFQAGRSKKFINTMGYLSWILLQLGWFFDLFFVAYYSWVKYFSPEYVKLLSQCSVLPIQLHCYNFNTLHFQLLTIVWVTFMLRSVFLFLIGMCINERFLKHIPPTDRRYEIASTGSDTDFDYDKVPKQLLIPYLLCNGQFPYTYPGSVKSRKMIKRELRKAQREKSKKKVQEGREEKHRRRILSAGEKEVEKIMQGFRCIRRAQVPLPKGRRKQFKIPIVTGVPDVTQLPPDLMTTQARAWLSEEESSDNLTLTNTFNRRKVPLSRRRKRRKRNRAELAQSTSLVRIHSENSMPLPIDETVRKKVMLIATRLSTDDSWSSDRSSLMENTGYAAEVEEEADQASRNDYMELMTYNVELRQRKSGTSQQLRMAN